MLRRYFFSDTAISLFLHLLKLTIALAINWIILAQFPLADFAIWAITSSILIVATASDLGIGQYATAQLIHASNEQKKSIVLESTFALVPLSIVAVFFVYFALGNQPLFYKVAMVIFIGFRILTVPFGAVLNSVNQFKLRKVIELGIYIFSLAIVLWVAYSGESVLWALLAFNFAFMVGGFITIIVSRRYLEFHSINLRQSSIFNIGQVYCSSVPFMVNNLTGLLTYGGFIWISSFILNTNDIARLSILHTFILINAYQIYDVTLRARQADLVYASYISKIRKVNIVLMVFYPLLVFIFGRELLSFVKEAVEFSKIEIFLFSAFVAIELGFLMVQSIAQVNKGLIPYLIRYSLVKFVCQGVAVFISWFAMSNSSKDFAIYILTLVTLSLLAYWVCYKHLKWKLHLLGEG